MQAQALRFAPTILGARWSRFLRGARRIWRTSLQFRTVAIAVVLSGLAVTVIGGYMSVIIWDILFSSRREALESVQVSATLLSLVLFTSALTF